MWPFLDIDSNMSEIKTLINYIQSTGGTCSRNDDLEHTLKQVMLAGINSFFRAWTVQVLLLLSAATMRKRSRKRKS